MAAWQLKASALKCYPHFDKNLPRAEAELIVTNPDRVRSNPFYPFLRYTRKWQPFRPSGKKARPIRYASRRDAYIFAYYRHLLAENYESTLATLGIQDCPIAYRKIPVVAGSPRGKCNIHFAKDAFERILTLGDCCAVTLDISRFFESLDHAHLRGVWCRLIGQADLPPDHAAVFKAITQYRVVDRENAYERLGYFGLTRKRGKECRGFLRTYEEMPTQLCTPREFRLKIAGGDPALPSLIERNDLSFGIPQGAPISDLLANIYLIDFDELMAKWVWIRGGVYFRYSDDILVIVPGGADEGRAARDYVRDQIARFGDKLHIKPEKSSIVRYVQTGEAELEFAFVDGAQGKNGLEYLGFRFDGRHVYLRDRTLSGFYRKITYSLRHETRALVARYPGKDYSFFSGAFDLERFVQRFGRVEDFDDNTDYREWTFWTYARRAAETFGAKGLPILHQLRGHRKLIKKRAELELMAALGTKSAPVMTLEASTS